MHPSILFDAIRKRYKLDSDSKLAMFLGVTSARISQMRSRPHKLSARQIVTYIDRAKKSGEAAALAEPIRAIVEMYPIDHTSSRQGAAVEMLPTGDGHPRNRAIRKCLEETKGVYIFFDSQGQAIYVGKNESGNLWSEMTSAFNRKISNNTAFFVDHPSTGKAFSPAWKKPRQPRRRIIHLRVSAMYFSAYEVSKPLVGGLEALLVRSFCNTLANKKMEKFKRVGTK
jgi:DNA-binding transcriptional regulator YdaS (Cro superfamily)